MLAQQQLPEFVTSEWYPDPSDHRCPHDAWLETMEIRELAEGERGEIRTTTIAIRLLGAYHDGHIVFRYSGVTRYSLASDDSRRGMGDWLEDRFSISADGNLRHDITWCFGPSTKSAWFVEAEGVSYEWIPKKG
jgi:hypothetical protein